MPSARHIVLKVGGSLITRKLRSNTFRPRGARRLGLALASFGEPVVLVHGTGSFGKPPARRYGYLDGFLAASRVSVVSSVEDALDGLRLSVLRELRLGGLNAVAVSAAALFQCRDGAITRCETWPLEALLRRGLTPVISGGILPDSARGFAVCSSDAMAASLALALRARRLIFATDTAGVLAPDTGRAALLQEVDVGLGATRRWPARDPSDVSGGMRGKLEAALGPVRRGIETLIVDGRRAGRLSRALAGRATPSTHLVASGGS